MTTDRVLPDDDGLLAAWVRRAVEEDDMYAYETLAMDLVRRGGPDAQGRVQRLAQNVEMLVHGWLHHPDHDAARLYALLGWQQSALFAAWLQDLRNIRVSEELKS